MQTIYKTKNGISIIIPYYKGKKYIDYTLVTLINSLQKSKLMYEIIIINDNPNEKCEIDCKFDRYPIKVVNNKSNYGIAKSRNIGKKYTRYKYLYFIDQDDWVCSDMFLYAAYYMNKGFDAIICNYYLSKKPNLKKGYNIFFAYCFRFITAKFLIKYGNLFTSTGQLVIKKSVAYNFIETNSIGSDDYYFFIELFLNKNKKLIKYIQKPLFIRRIHNENYSYKANFIKSSLECFYQLSKKYTYVRHYKHLLITRYSGNRITNLTSKLLKKLTTFNGEDVINLLLKIFTYLFTL